MKTATKTKGWPPERRHAQSARMRAAKIWRLSTGPRTAQGKARAAQNARRHGNRSLQRKTLSMLLTAQSRYRRTVTACYKLGLPIPWATRVEGAIITIALQGAVSYYECFPLAPNPPTTSTQ